MPRLPTRPYNEAIGGNLDGERDVLGVGLGPTRGEGAKQHDHPDRAAPRGSWPPDRVLRRAQGLSRAIRLTWPEAAVGWGDNGRKGTCYGSKKHCGRSPR